MQCKRVEAKIILANKVDDVFLSASLVWEVIFENAEQTHLADGTSIKSV